MVPCCFTGPLHSSTCNIRTLILLTFEAERTFSGLRNELTSKIIPRCRLRAITAGPSVIPHLLNPSHFASRTMLLQTPIGHLLSCNDVPTPSEEASIREELAFLKRKIAAPHSELQHLEWLTDPPSSSRLKYLDDDNVERSRRHDVKHRHTTSITARCRPTRLGGARLTLRRV